MTNTTLALNEAKAELSLLIEFTKPLSNFDGYMRLATGPSAVIEGIQKAISLIDATLSSAGQAQSTPKTAAANRVQKYLDERAKSRQLDQEEITSLHSGDEREAALLVSDLRALIAEQAQAVAPSMDSIYAAWRAVGADLAGLSWDKFQAAILAALQPQAVNTEEKESTNLTAEQVDRCRKLTLDYAIGVFEAKGARMVNTAWVCEQLAELKTLPLDASVITAPSSEGSRP